MRRDCLVLAVSAVALALTFAASPAMASRLAVIDPNYHANADAVAQYSAHVQYRDDATAIADADADEADADDAEAEEDTAFVSVGEGSDDDGIYYDAANMPSWLVPPWVTPNAPTGPLLPTYGSGYLTKTFNIKQWKGAVPPQPVFPLDSGYAYAAVDSDHHPYGGVFPNDARYHSPSLTVTAPIFAETETTITATADTNAEGEAETETEAEAEAETSSRVQIDVNQLPRLVPVQPQVSADAAVEQTDALEAFLNAEDAEEEEEAFVELNEHVDDSDEEADAADDEDETEADDEMDAEDEADDEADDETEADAAFIEVDTAQLPRLTPVQPRVSAEAAVQQADALEAFLTAEEPSTAAFVEVDDDVDTEDEDEDEAEEEMEADDEANDEFDADA